MAKHFWLIRNYKPATLDRAAEVVSFIMKRAPETPHDIGVKFLCYVMNQIRQSGGLDPTWDEDGNLFFPSVVLTRWEGAVRSGHRYTRGRRAADYLAGGKRLLEAMAGRYQFIPGTPSEIIWDALMEGSL